MTDEPGRVRPQRSKPDRTLIGWRQLDDNGSPVSVKGASARPESYQTRTDRDFERVFGFAFDGAALAPRPATPSPIFLAIADRLAE